MEGLTLLCHIPVQSPRVRFGALSRDKGAAGSGGVVTAALGVTPCSRFPSSGSMNQFTAIYNGNGELINNIKYYDGFMGQRVGAISCLAFHPHWVCIRSIWVRDLHFLVNVGAGRGKGTGTRCAPTSLPEGALSLTLSPGPWGFSSRLSQTAMLVVSLVPLVYDLHLGVGQGSRQPSPLYSRINLIHGSRLLPRLQHHSLAEISSTAHQSCPRGICLELPGEVQPLPSSTQNFVCFFIPWADPRVPGAAFTPPCVCVRL